MLDIFILVVQFYSAIHNLKLSYLYVSYMKLYNIIFKLSAIILTAILLSSCGRTDKCLEPDDFGYAKVAISSRYNELQIFGDQTSEITPWIDKDLILDGKVLYIEVKNWVPGEDPNVSGVLSAWCPWYGQKGEESTLGYYCARLDPCFFVGAQKCVLDAQGHPADDACLTNAMCTDTTYAQIANPPCLMTKGVGLYALLTEPPTSRSLNNPNASVDMMSNPPGLTMHMGAPHSKYYIYSLSDTGRYTDAGGVLYDYDGDHTSNSSRLGYINGKLYFKIVDNFYQDNNGQYRAFIKSGIFNGAWDPISWCIDLVKTALFGNGSGRDYQNGGEGIIPAIYESIVANSSFVSTVRAALILYVIFAAFGFLLGSIELTQKELMNRVLKVIFMTILISPNSWEFFNEHVFIWFYEGTDFVIGILQQVAASGPGSSNPLAFFFSEEIFIKLSSLLFAVSTGWIYIIVYVIMLIFIVIIYFDAAVLYMTALIMVGVLIVVAPIFILLALFEQTKSFFENWLKQIMSYTIQMILVYAGILFMTMILRNQIYNTLGFATCAIQFPTIDDITIFEWYFPKIAGPNNAPPLAKIPVPKDHFATDHDFWINGNPINPPRNEDNTAIGGSFQQTIEDSETFCSAYECISPRYPDLPFLDPQNPYESKLINQMRDGYVGDFGGLAIIVVCVYLMHHFNQSTVSMAKFLSNTTANAGDNSRAAASSSAGLKSAIMAPVKYADNKLGVSAAVRDKIKDAKMSLAQAKYDIIDKPWADHKIASLRKDAAQGGLKSVRTDAEKLSGMSHAEATEFNKNHQSNKYFQELQKLLTTPGSKAGNAIDSSNVDAYTVSNAIMSKLSDGKAGDFKDIVAKELFAKNSEYSSLKGKVSYDKLSDDHKALINRLSDDMKGMLDAKTKQDLYAEKYVESYLKMSDEGVGFLRKRSETARDAYKEYSSLKKGYQSLKDSWNEAESRWDESSLNRGRAINKYISDKKSSLLPDSLKEVNYKELYYPDKKEGANDKQSLDTESADFKKTDAKNSDRKPSVNSEMHSLSRTSHDKESDLAQDSKTNIPIERAGSNSTGMIDDSHGYKDDKDGVLEQNTSQGLKKRTPIKEAIENDTSTIDDDYLRNHEKEQITNMLKQGMSREEILEHLRNERFGNEESSSPARESFDDTKAQASINDTQEMGTLVKGQNLVEGKVGQDLTSIQVEGVKVMGIDEALSSVEGPVQTEPDPKDKFKLYPNTKSEQDTPTRQAPNTGRGNVADSVESSDAGSSESGSDKKEDNPYDPSGGSESKGQSSKRTGTKK